MTIRNTLTLKATCGDLRNEVARVPLTFWTVSVFRFYLVRSLLQIQPSLKMVCEWNRIDLAIQTPEGVSLVEIKFWPFRSLAAIMGKDQHRFGYHKKTKPGAKHYAEYQKVLAKLHSAARNPWAARGGGIASTFLVLVYADPVEATIHPTFGTYYDGIVQAEPVRSVEVIECRSPVDPDRVLTCKLLEVSV